VTKGTALTREQAQSARASLSLFAHGFDDGGDALALLALAIIHREIGSALLQRMERRLGFVPDVIELGQQPFNNRVKWFKGETIITALGALPELGVAHAHDFRVGAIAHLINAWQPLLFPGFGFRGQ
jgi:hypothetical protein